jgi:hypothetical protein
LDEDWAKMLQEGMTDLLNDGHESVGILKKFHVLVSFIYLMKFKP